MEKVFIVFKETDYANVLVAVYATEEAALAHAMKSSNLYYDEFEVKK